MGFYLLENQNPHAPRGYWGHPTRRERVRLLVIHTSESPFDTSGADTGAEAVANYLSNTDRAASYHTVGDSDSLVRLLPYDYTAFGARGHNAHAVHLAFAGRAADWPKLSDRQVDARLSVLAREAREVCSRFGIPVVRLQGAAARTDTARGICGHADVDPDRRSDPGDRFPWTRFLQMIEGDEMNADQQKLLEDIHGAVIGEGSGLFAILSLLRKVRVTQVHMRGELDEFDGRGDVDVAALAAALSDELGADIAAELGRRLAGN